MQTSWNQWSTPVNPVNNYGAASFTNTFPPIPNATNAATFPVQSAAPITNAPINTQFPPNVYGAQQTQSTQQQWQQWEQWHQQYAQWQQQYGDKYQGPVPTPAMVPSAFPAVPPLPPSAPSAQPPPPDSLPPVDKDDSLKRPHEGSLNEDAKKSKPGKGKQETLESLIESEKTFDQQFKSWEASFLQWKEQNVNHPDKTQYKEYEAKCESYREQLLQKREVLRKKREAKEADVAAAAAAAKEAALATSSAATAQQIGYSSTATTQNTTFMPPPNMMYPPISPMVPNPAANTFVPNYSMYSMPPPLALPSLSAPPPLGAPIDDDPTKKNSQSLEFLSTPSAMSGAKSIPGLDLVGSEKNPAANFAPNIPPTSTLFSAYNRDITKPLHTSEDKPFDFPRPAQQSYGPNTAENRYPYPGGPPNFDNDSRMSHSNRTVPFSQFDRPNQIRDGIAPCDRPNQMRDGNTQFDRSNAQFGHNQMREGNQPFDRPNPMRDSNDRFKNQTSYPPNEYGDRGDYQYRKNEPPDSNYRNNDRSKFGGNSSFTFNSDKYAKYLEDEYDDSRFRDEDPEDDYSQNKSDYQRDNSYRNNNYSNRQNFRNDSGPQFGRNRGGDRDFNDRNYNRDFNNREDVRPSLQDRNKDGPNFGGFNREGDRFGGGRGFDRPFGKDNKSFGTDAGFGKNAPFGKDSGFGKGAMYGKGTTFGKDNSDMKEPLNKFDIEKNITKESPKPISLLDLPLMKPPEAFDKLQPPPITSLESFDPKVQPPFLKPPDPFDSKRNASISEIKNGLPPMNEPPPNSINFADKKNISLGHEEKPLTPVAYPVVPGAHPVVPVEQPVVPIEQPVALEPFVASQILEYNHVCVSSEDNSAFEPIWVFDYSHGKKKTLDTFDLIPKSDVVTETVSKPESLLKDDNVWAGDPWEEKDTGPSQTPLPERSRNSPFMNKKLNDERNSNTSGSLLDRREPLNNKNKDSMNKDRNGDKSWLPEKKIPEEKPPTKLIDELLLPPGRNARPTKIVIIMRGPPGSGKTYTAKMIKDKEVEMGGNAPRILSLDDYFAIEDMDLSGDKESSAINYKYDADSEPSYLDSLVKSFKKNVTDGFFPFIIVDSVNEKLKKYDEMYNFAKSRGFQVFVCEMDRDVSVCKKQDIHDRSEEDISKIIEEWEPTPSSQTVLDVQNLLKTSVEKMEVETEEKPVDEQVSKSDKETIDIFKADSEPEDTKTPDDSKTEDKTEPSTEKEAEEYSSYMESKWDKMEQTEEKLARLDGVTRKRSTSFKEWLQLPEERDISWYVSLDAGSTSDASVSKKKRVRWADLEERMAQQKMREIGFVVGQTDWKRMMDPTFGGNALTQTKYI